MTLPIGLSDRSLCTRCGTCVGAAANGSLRLGKEMFPEATGVGSVPEIAGAVCPGAKVNYQELTQITFGDQSDTPTFDGHVRKTFVGYATDGPMRSGGAGGGLVTALLWDLLRHGDVEGCIVSRMKPGSPWLGEPFIARTYEELMTSQGSKYTIIPLNAILAEVRNLPGRYAYAGLPCQVHGLRTLMHQDPAIREKISAVVGLFCGGALEPFFVIELLRARGIDPLELRDFQFRGGEWPGRMRAILKDGRAVDLHYSNYKDGAYNYSTALYMPLRCQTCIDGSGHFSDVSVSDAWTRDEQGNYKFRDHSRLLVRTELGQALVETAVRRGTIVASDVTRDPSYQTHRMQTKRKGMIVPLRIARLARLGVPVPIYDRATPESSLAERLKERSISLLLTMARRRWLRYPMLKFLTSKYAIPLIHFRLWVKSYRYRRNP